MYVCMHSQRGKLAKPVSGGEGPHADRQQIESRVRWKHGMYNVRVGPGAHWRAGRKIGAMQPALYAYEAAGAGSMSPEFRRGTAPCELPQIKGAFFLLSRRRRRVVASYRAFGRG